MFQTYGPRAKKYYSTIAIDRATERVNSNKETKETYLLGIDLFCIEPIC